MKKHNERLEDTQIDSPCPATWADMAGDEQTRHCEQCNKQVHNLAAMTREAGEALLREPTLNERVCVRMEFHGDGRCITSDDPRESACPSRLAAAALAFGVGLSAACHTKEDRSIDLRPDVVEAPGTGTPNLPEQFELVGEVSWVGGQGYDAGAIQPCPEPASEPAPHCGVQQDEPLPSSLPPAVMGTPRPPRSE